MIDNLRTIWEERSSRERRMLAVMFGLIAIALLWFAILSPLFGATAAAQARLDRATLDAGEVAAAAADLRASARNAPPPLATTVPLAVSQSAESAGFTLTAVDPQPDGSVSIAIPAARGPAVFGWIADMSRQGIRIERLTVRSNPDGTLGVEAGLRGPQ
ncbi:MAG: type II secretion system protein GspM [Sphingomonadaceae bacterium]